MHIRKLFSLAALLAVLAACDDEGPTGPVRNGYDLTISGDVAARVRGDALFGADTDESGSPIFAIALGQDTSRHIVLLGRSGAAAPARGQYRIGTDGSDWNAVYLLTDGDELLGVLVADSGRITITGSSATRLDGSLDLHATGFLEGGDEPARVRVAGTFTARPATAPAALARSKTILPF